MSHLSRRPGFIAWLGLAGSTICGLAAAWPAARWPTLGVLVAALVHRSPIAIVLLLYGLLIFRVSYGAAGLTTYGWEPALLLLATTLVRRQGSRPLCFHAPDPVMTAVLLGYAGLVCLGMFHSPDQWLGLNYLRFAVLEGAVLWLLVRSAITKAAEIRLVLLLMLGAGLVVSAAAVVANVSHGGGYAAAPRLFFDHYTYLGIYLVMTGTVALGSVGDHAVIPRAVGLLTALVIIMALPLTYSRNAWVTGLIILVPMFIAWPRLRWPAVLLSGALTAVVLLQTGLEARFETLLHPTSDYTVDRIYMWQAALESFKASPVVGWGITSFPGLYADFAPPAASGSFLHAHNVVLNVAAEQGIVGLAGFSAIAAAIAWRITVLVRSTRATEWYGLACGLAASLAGLVVSGAFDNFLYTRNLVLIGWFHLSLLEAVARIGHAGGSRNEQQTGAASSGPAIRALPRRRGTPYAHALQGTGPHGLPYHRDHA